MSILQIIGRRGSECLFALAFLVALWRVLSLDSSESGGNKKVLRLSHWQMEAGVREAIDEAIRGYEKLHPDVEIKQLVVGERHYGSWITTRLIGDTAPDIIAMGTMDQSCMLPLLQKYFVPLGREVSKPNPYNAGSPLEGVPWRDSFYDHMEGNYTHELLDYFQVPCSAFTVRLFYNKKKFRDVTGLDAPPGNFREFIAVCDRIRACRDKTGQKLIPIAGAARYNTKFLWERFDQAVNSTLLPEVDLDFDGEIPPEESVIAIVRGSVSLRDERIRAMFRGREEYDRQFQPGFYSADRMDAAFLFLQQRALMIASGAWDAESYRRNADFEIGVCDFPLPERDDPEFGKLVEGPPVEELQGSFALGVNRTSPNREVALDFLRYFTSKKVNGQFNSRVQWIPMVRGNRPNDAIAAFWPRFEGVKAGIHLDVGGQNANRFEELSNLHAAGRIDFDGFVRGFESTYLANSDLWMRTDWIREMRLGLDREEFAKTAAIVDESPPANGDAREIRIFGSEALQRYHSIEISRRYEEARTHSPLPKP